MPPGRRAVEKHHAHDICGGEPVIARLPQVDRHRNADPIDLAGRVVAAAKLVDRDEEVAEQPIIDRNLLSLRSRGKPSQQVAIDRSVRTQGQSYSSRSAK